MQVIATATGYDNVAVRTEGDIFTCPKNAKGQDIIGDKPDGSPKVSWYKEYEPRHRGWLDADGRALRTDAEGRPLDADGRPFRTDASGRPLDASGKPLRADAGNRPPDASGRPLNPDGTPRVDAGIRQPDAQRDSRTLHTPDGKKRDGRDLA